MDDDDSAAWLDFNENPCGTPTVAVQRVAANLHALHRYPRGLHEETSAAAATYFGVEADRVVLTAGVDEAIDLVVGLVGRAWTFVPGFNAFWERPACVGVPVDRLAGGHPAPAVSARTAAAGVALLARPDNPTGVVVDEAWLSALLERAPLVFVDETYLEFGELPSVLRAHDEADNLCVFKSFSKAFGLAGIRVGAVVASRAVAARLRDRQRFYSVDSVALHALAACLEESDEINAAVAYVKRARPAYAAALRRHGGLFSRVQETPCNFVLAECSHDVDALASSLAEAGVRVATTAQFGLPGWIRVSVGAESALARLDAALAATAARARDPSLAR